MIPLIKSTFYNEKETKKSLISFIRRADKLSIGEECLKFERSFAKFQKRNYAMMVNSGSSANLAIVQALLNMGKIRPGDAVGFSTLTWSTNVMPLIQLGLEPVPVDIELDTLNMSSQTLLQTLKKTKLKMVFLTNLLGFCDDIDEIARICRKRNIILIEDNCESLGTRYKGKLLGNFGLASTCSFYVGHHMSTIEGGIVCTNNNELFTMLQFVRAHGWDRNLTEQRQLNVREKYKVNSTFYSRYTFYDLGYNLRTTEISGFLGNVQLPYLPEIIQKRNENFFEMAVPIYARDDLYYPIRYDHIDFISNFAIPVICRSEQTRKELVKKCEGLLEIRPVVGGDMTHQPFYKKYFPKTAERKNTNAKLIHDQGLYFGNNPELTTKEKKLIIKLFTEIDL